MGKISIITPKQQVLLDELSKDLDFTSKFYFSGGTALSLYYLAHRQSIDLDFFSERTVDVLSVTAKVNTLSLKHNFAIDYIKVEDTHIFNLIFNKNESVKVDFAFYPYKRLEKGKKIGGMEVDSFKDIAVNKLVAAIQRSEVKDFVDLFFLLKEFTLWDLIDGVKVKFNLKFDPLFIGSDFLKVEQFDYLPKMIKPLDIETLKSFFRQKAKDLASQSIE